MHQFDIVIVMAGIFCVLPIPRNGSSRPKSLDVAGIVYSSCGVDTVSNFNSPHGDDRRGFKHVQKKNKKSYLKSARDNGQHPFKRVDSGHLDANVSVSLEPQQILNRCTAWRMWPIATARKRRRSSFTLKLV